MALTGLSPLAMPMEAAAPPRPARIATFVSLKLRITISSARGQTRRQVGLILSLVVGLFLAFIGFVTLLSTGFDRSSTGLVVAGLIGSVIVAGWILFPLLYFGVDETLDPARFALLPLSRHRLMVGMFASAWVGVPAVATSLALGGPVVGALIRARPGVALAALAGFVLTVSFCIVASRAITSAFATALRSRRSRDVASVMVALFGVSIGPLEIILSRVAVASGASSVVRVVHWLGWTPLAAGLVAPFDVAAGAPLHAIARLAMLGAALALMAWWWTTSIDDAMVGPTAAALVSARAARGGAVAALVPRLLRHLPPGIFLGIVAREMRYWFRDPRRRTQLISVGIGGLFLPIAFSYHPTGGSGFGPPVSLTASFIGVVGGSLLINIFSFDGTTYAAHLLASVPARVELRARVVAITILVAPALLVVTVAVAWWTHRLGDLPTALGTSAASFGSALGIGAMLCVLTAYPMPDSRNMFAMSSGQGAERGLLAVVGMIGAPAVSLPVYAAAFFIPGPAKWLMAPLGIGWGLGVTAVGCAVGAARLQRRGPELLLAVTPRR